MSYSRETAATLREILKDLDAAVRKLDSFDYESLGHPDLDAQMTKVYQSLFAAGDSVNAARHINNNL